MSKVMIVTGAGKGIGAAIAELAGQRGYAVCVNYAHSQDAAEQVVARIAGVGGKAIAVQADVSQLPKRSGCSRRPTVAWGRSMRW